MNSLQQINSLLSTRWLPGFARVRYYAPSPCHMHPDHNCHHIKSCHPPDKQYTEFIIYICSLFLICNNKVSMARATLWDHQPSLPSSTDALCLPSIIASSLPLHSPSLPLSISLLPSTCSLPPPPSPCSLLPPPSSLRLPPSLLPSIPPLVPSLLPHPPLLPPSHPPSFLAPCLPPPCLPTSRRPTQFTPCLCV